MEFILPPANNYEYCVILTRAYNEDVSVKVGLANCFRHVRRQCKQNKLSQDHRSVCVVKNCPKEFSKKRWKNTSQKTLHILGMENELFAKPYIHQHTCI